MPITIQVERIVAYPDEAAVSKPQVLGKPPAEPAPPQKPPRGGTAARVDATKVAARVERLPHTLLGWCGSDDIPEVVPATAVEAGDSGVMLSVPAGSVPEGGRRAGLTSHQFQPRMVGQEQRVHGGWLESDGSDRVQYAPQAKAGYRLPPSKLAFILASASIAFRMKKHARRRRAPTLNYRRLRTGLDPGRRREMPALRGKPYLAFARKHSCWAFAGLGLTPDTCTCRYSARPADRNACRYASQAGSPVRSRLAAFGMTGDRAETRSSQPAKSRMGSICTSQKPFGPGTAP